MGSIKLIEDIRKAFGVGNKGAEPQGLSNAIGTGERSDEVIGVVDLPAEKSEGKSENPSGERRRVYR